MREQMTATGAVERGSTTAVAGEMTPTIVIGGAEAAWARRLLGSMPFGAAAHFRSTSFHGTGEMTVRNLLDDLDRLREVLAEHATSCEAAERELSSLRSDVAAVRRVLGTPSAMHGYAANGQPVTVRS